VLQHLVNERHAVRCRAEDWDPLYAFPSLTAEVTNPVRASLEAHFPAGIPVVSPGRQPTRKFSARSPACIFGSPLHGGLWPE
jgi:hypothetical protein